MPGCSSRSRASAAARAEARRLVDWFHRKFHDEVTSYLVDEKVFRRFGPQSASPDMEAMRAGHENLRYHLAYIGHLAETRSWLAGDAMSFADLAAAAHLSALDYLGEVPWEEHEAAKNWYALLKSRPSFRPLLAGSRRGLHPGRDLCRPRFLSFDSSYRRKPVSRVQSAEQVALDSGLRRNDGADGRDAETDRIADEAKALGFDAVRFASAERRRRRRRGARQFLAEGRQGDMAWLAGTAERRKAPRALWPEARSVILLGLNYGARRRSAGDPATSHRAARSRSMRKAPTITTCSRRSSSRSPRACRR